MTQPATTQPAPADSPPPLPAEVEYIGFWARFWASVVDTVIFTLIVVPPIILLFGDKLYGMFLLEMEEAIAEMPWAMQQQMAEVYPWLMEALEDPQLAQIPPNLHLLVNLFSGITVAILILIFWKWRSATPGKMLLHAVIVDARTLQEPTNIQLLIRYIGYYICAFLTAGIGFFMVGWTPRKQGLHDILARTVVIRQVK